MIYEQATKRVLQVLGLTASSSRCIEVEDALRECFPENQCMDCRWWCLNNPGNTVKFINSNRFTCRPCNNPEAISHVGAWSCADFSCPRFERAVRKGNGDE